MKYQITIQDEGKRLDKFLVEILPETTRSQIQKKIKTGFVFVNSKNPTVHQFLKLNDEVEVLESAQKDQQNFVEPKIISETNDYLILEKPAGLMVHKANSSQEKTLADWLVEKYPETKDVYDHQSPTGANRPGIVHRLDKEVSGLILVVKNQRALDFFKKQFKDRKVVKKYQALVYGQITKEELEIKTPLVMRHGKSVVRTDEKVLHTENTYKQEVKEKMTLENETTGFVQYLEDEKEEKEEVVREAITTVRPIKTFFNYTLLDVDIKTGRTHQIRTHLKSIGHQIVGDILYQTKVKNQKMAQKRKEDREVLDRIFLHSYFLEFTDLVGEKISCQIDLDQQLEDFLKTVK